MKRSRALIAVAASVAILLSTAGCDSGDDELKSEKTSEAQQSQATKDAKTNAPAQPPEKKLDEGQTDKSVEYTDPSTADDYCGVFDGMEKFAAESEEQTQEASFKQMQDRMEILERTAGKLADLTDDSKEEKQWKAMKSDTKKALDFLKSTGGDVQNTDFLYLFGKSYESSSKAYKAQQKKVEDKCGVDLSQFLAPADKKAADEG